jgi:hypothetical protein
MRTHMVEQHRDGVRVVLTVGIAATVVAGMIGFLEFRPTADKRAENTRAVETAQPPSAAAGAALEERDRLTVRRLRNVGKDIPWHWRRRLVRGTAPALAGWIAATGERLGAADARPVPDALHDRLALSFTSVELSRARYVVAPAAMVAARDAGFHFGRRYALAFGDVIVFRNETAAGDEIEWARQLVYLRLYHQWGPERFATKYLESWRRIDNTAMRLSARHAQALTAIHGPGMAASAGAANHGK